MSIKAIVVDDEPLARQRLTRLLSELDINVVAQGADGKDAVQLSDQYSVDIVFLDINMPNQNGLDAAKEIVSKQDQPPSIIFCTAYDNYALEAFTTNAAAYLLKPVSRTHLNAAISKSQSVSRIQIQAWLGKQSVVTTLAIKTGSITQNIPTSEFLYFLTIEKNVYAMQIDKGETLVNYTLKELEEILPDTFIRIHRNCVLNRDYIEKLIRGKNSAARVTLRHTDKEFDVSRRHLKQVKEVFNEKL